MPGKTAAPLEGAKQMKRISNLNWLTPIALLLAILVYFPPVFSQDEDFEDEEMEAEAQCIPESLTTIYDRFKMDNVSENQINLWYDYGRDYYTKAKYGKKIKHYKTAVKHFWKVVINDQTGRFKATYARLAECYTKLNEVDSTLIVVYRGLKKYPKYATLHYHAARIHNTLGRGKCAIPHYEALTENNSQDSTSLKNYWAALAKLYFQEDDEKAIAAQIKVTDLDPNDVEAATFLVQLTEYFGMDPMKAKEAAFQKDTTNIRNARSLGITAMETGQYKKALRAFNAVLVQNPQNIEARMYIGNAYEGLTQPTQAIKSYKSILEFATDKPNVYCAIASVYARLNDFPTAQSYIRRAQRIDRNYGYSYMVMGEIYENSVSFCSANRGQKGYSYDDKLVFELARKEYQKAAARDPNVAVSANNRFNQMEAFIPTKADKHMQSNRTDIKDKCYSWIKQ